MRDYDGAVEMYHQALSRKPDETFSAEMLNHALEDAMMLQSFDVDTLPDVL